MIKRLLQSTVRGLGYEVRPYRPPVPSRLGAFLQAWRRVGPRPAFIIDVGANHGRWTQEALEFFPDASFLLIEPQERLKESLPAKDLLQNPKIRWMTAGIGDQCCAMMLAVLARDDSASFAMAEADARAGGHAQIPVPVITLDEVVRQEGRIPDIVKIDAEGFDLRALKGASRLLGTTELIFVECSVCSGFQENTLAAVTAFMGTCGYRVMDFTDLNQSPKHGVLWLVEVAFVRESSSAWKKIVTYE